MIYARNTYAHHGETLYASLMPLADEGGGGRGIKNYKILEIIQIMKIPFLPLLSLYIMGEHNRGLHNINLLTRFIDYRTNQKQSIADSVKNRA